MSPAPVGDSAADKKPFRTGPFVREITDRLGDRRPSLPRSMSHFPFTAPTTPGGVEPLPADDNLGLHYDTDWARGPGSRVVRRIIQRMLLGPALRAITPTTIYGLDRLEHLQGPVVFAANHHSHVDTGLLIHSLPDRFRNRSVVAAGADYFFDKNWKAIVSALSINAVPIERKKVSRTSADNLLKLLRRDWSLIIFPEGGRSDDGWGQDYKPGAAFLAIRRVCPIVPVHIHGTSVVLPKGSSFPKRYPTSITFGDPIVVSEHDDPRALTQRLAEAITLLGDEESSDWWSARKRAASGSSTSLSGPDSASDWRRQWERSRRKAVKDIENERGRRSWP
jgi:1-acyl-sn-glycerol-3-phosphate acyltransferase